MKKMSVKILKYENHGCLYNTRDWNVGFVSVYFYLHFNKSFGGLKNVILTKKSGKFQISRTFNPILKRYQMRSSFNVVFSLKSTLI